MEEKEWVEVKLKHGVMKIDKEDWDRLKHITWYTSNLGKKDYYVKCNKPKERGLLSDLIHRNIMNAPKDMDVDHIFHDTLDNRKSKLNVCPHRINCQNKRKQKRKHKNSSSFYLGVSWRKTRKKWRSYITIRGKVKELGAFDSEIEAAKTRDREAIRSGEIYVLNFPRDTYSE